jgi:hypothetical protein
MEFENYGSLNEILGNVYQQNQCLGCLNDCTHCEHKFTKRSSASFMDRTGGREKVRYEES